MDGERCRSSGQPTSVHDERAIAAAMALFSFFLATKICLFLWLVLVKRHHPLADVPADGPIYLLGPDLFICLLVALAVLALREAGSRGGKVGAGIARLARGLIYGGGRLFFLLLVSVSPQFRQPPPP